VLLLAESAGLAAVLHHLLDPGDRLSRLGTLRELAGTRALENADVVLLDVPAEDRAETIGQVRRRYLGPLVVLVARGDATKGLPLDDDATLLTRPFSAEALGSALGRLGHPGGFDPGRQELARPLPPLAERLSAATAAAVGPGAALAGTGTAAPAAPAAPGSPGAAAGPGTPSGAATPAGPSVPSAEPPMDAAKVLADVKAAARQAPVRARPATPPGRLDLVDRAQRALVAFTQGWKARRRVRVAGFSAFALVAFTVAFALASQGHCGPGCDAFGTVFSPEPTIAASQSTAPSTTGSKRSTTTTTTARAAGSPGTGAFRGISGGRLATTTRQTTTTTWEPATTTRPATTRPPATTKPPTPTTQPPTTPTPTTPTTTPPTTGGA
jgi:hypothetical protein